MRRSFNRITVPDEGFDRYDFEELSCDGTCYTEKYYVAVYLKT